MAGGGVRWALAPRATVGGKAGQAHSEQPEALGIAPALPTPQKMHACSSTPPGAPPPPRPGNSPGRRPVLAALSTGPDAVTSLRLSAVLLTSSRVQADSLMVSKAFFPRPQPGLPRGQFISLREQFEGNPARGHLSTRTQCGP